MSYGVMKSLLILAKDKELLGSDMLFRMQRISLTPATDVMEPLSSCTPRATVLCTKILRYLV
jgi:hypothetical protein